MYIFTPILFVVMSLGDFVCVLTSAGADTKQHINDGFIVTSDREGGLDLYSVDGTDQATILFQTEKPEFDAVCSPDGSRIAFVRANEIISSSALWIADRDGTNAKELIGHKPNTVILTPDWNPNGRQIAYSIIYLDQVVPLGHRKVEIWIIDIESTETRRVVDGSFPDWAPDGLQLLYTAYAHLETGEAQRDKRVSWKTQTAVYDTRENTSTILYHKHSWFGRWNSDGSAVAFIERSLTPDPFVGITILNLTEAVSNPLRISVDHAYPFSLCWLEGSPEKIFFSGIHNKKPNSTGISVFSINTNGENQHVVVSHPGASVDSIAGYGLVITSPIPTKDNE